jgi:ATP-dependent RNA helicase DeaD
MASGVRRRHPHKILDTAVCPLLELQIMSLNPNIAPALARALETKGFSALTEVQEAMLTPEAAGADLLVSAQTGSGKTVAFGMAIAPTLLDGEERFQQAALPQALIVAPTRELALQVQRELIWLFGDARGRIASCVGGMDARQERRALERGCHIVVGTPGRLRDHITRGALDMSALQAVVLDEADEMLDFGFREDLEYILDAAPEERRTLLFSATVPRAIATLAKQFQKNAVRISTVGETSQHVDIDYRAMPVAPSDRENAITNILRFYDAESAIVFCATREAVNRLAARFGNRGFSVVALSGELSQSERTHALQAMRDGRARVCIATDVAARGIDLPGLELVIHADLPTNADTLKHRSGRTGRAGRKGTCVLIVPHTRRGRANGLLRNARIEAEWVQAPTADDVKTKDRERLLADPSLTETYDEDAMTFARELLEKHSTEQIAAAFLNRKQAEMPAAEDLLAAPMGNDRGGRDRGGRDRDRKFDRNDRGPRPDREPREPRAPFQNGVRFNLSAGHKHRAEPRWLLPLICRLGHITKKDVGSIDISDANTVFEISEAKAEFFYDAVKANGGGEKSIRITKASDGPANANTDLNQAMERNAPASSKSNARHQAQKTGPRGGAAPSARYEGKKADTPRYSERKTDGKKPEYKPAGGSRAELKDPNYRKPGTKRPGAKKPAGKKEPWSPLQERSERVRPPRANDKPKRGKPEASDWTLKRKKKPKTK